MRNYNEQMEAAYLSSKRQGDMMRDRDRERGTHDNRKNRYIADQEQPGTQRYQSEMESRDENMPHYRTADNNTHNHQGKGPRNYRRSDDRIKEIVCDTLCDNPYLDASNIEVEVKNCEVVLTGWVDNRRAKRLAEDLSENINGVAHVENRIRVQQDQSDRYESEQANLGIA